jgi:F0F1-type ATP synthase assembly protein I
MAPYLDLGWRLAASVAGPPILGHLLVDQWWGTTPWGVLVGAGIGVAGGIVQLRRLQVELDR